MQALARVDSQLSKHGQQATAAAEQAIKNDSRLGLYKSNMQIAEPSEKNLASAIHGYDMASSQRNTAFEMVSQHSKTSRVKQLQTTWRLLCDKIKDLIE